MASSSTDNEPPAGLAAPTWRAPLAARVGLGVGAAGVAAWAARWALQGGDTFWTDVARRFYEPDATLGWVLGEASWVWLGAEGLIAAGGVVLGAGSLMWLGGRLGRRPKLARAVRVLATLGALVCLAVPALPLWAFVSGTPPAGATLVMPESGADAGQPPAPPFEPQARRWRVAEAARGGLVAVRIEAGNETFDARFTPVTGALELELGRPSASVATLSVPAASIETGVALRDDHARGYLRATEHPTITLAGRAFRLAPDGRFVASGEVVLMGRTISTPVEGRVVMLDAAQRADVGVQADEAMLATATFVVRVSETPLERSNFDSDRLVVTARVVLVPAP